MSEVRACKECGLQAPDGDLLEAGWYRARYWPAHRVECPTHAPTWFAAWAEEKLEARAYRRRYQVKAERAERSNAAVSAPDRWVLDVQWPTAWEPSSDFFEAAAARAYELGGGTCGGGIMTGAPLYNSPSNLSAAFTDEASALSFVEFTKAYFAPLRHDNCDTRFWQIKLDWVRSYDLQY